MDADGKNVQRLTHAVGYDGGAVLRRRLHAHRLARVAAEAGPGAGRVPAPARAEPGAADQARALRRRTPTAANAHAGDVPRRGVVRARVHARAASASSSRRTTAIRRGASSICGRSTSTARASSGSPPRPGSTAFRCSRPTASAWCSRRTARRRPGSTTPTCSSPTGTRRRRCARRRARRRSDPRPTSAGWPIPRARGAASARRGSRPPGAYIEARFKALGLAPAGDGGGYRQTFPVRTGLKVEPRDGAEDSTRRAVARDAFEPARVLGDRQGARGRCVLAGYGLRRQGRWASTTTPGLDVKGKIVVVRRFVPDHPAFATPERQRRAGDLRQKAWLAREHGAARAAWSSTCRRAPARTRPPTGTPPSTRRRCPAPRAERLRRRGHAGADRQARGAGADASRSWRRSKRVTAEVEVALTLHEGAGVQRRRPAAAARARTGRSGCPASVVSSARTTITWAWAGTIRWRPTATSRTWAPTTTPRGRRPCSRSRAPLARAPARCARDVVFVAFSGEEEGDARLDALHAHAAGRPDDDDVRAMINLDMVGRLRDNRATVLGAASATEWPALLGAACADARIECAPSTTAASAPATRCRSTPPACRWRTSSPASHSDYHKPSRHRRRINAAGAGADRRGGGGAGDARRRRAPTPLTFQQHGRPAARGRHAQLQRVAGDDPRLRRSARRRAGRAARGRAPGRRRPRRAACAAATS